MSGRQRTLFQTWGSSVWRQAAAPGGGAAAERPQRPGSPGAPLPAAAAPPPEPDDDVLLVAVCEAERRLGLEPGGFCTAAGALWIYPTNCPVRDYQLHISRAALFCNTLVCLPTGLGKTFIAAVVMYNFYRWFPSGKVVFMAPTKPLVTQQIEACYRLMGIPQSHMAEMTGSTQALTRKEIWYTKRVLFLTPQVMVNDLTRGACPAADIKCLVVDEAHKALGNYAYCQVVRELLKYTSHFRILALTATPGSDIKAVQQVVSNLLVGQIELRAEDSPDVLPYSHERRVEKLVVPLGEELAAVQKMYIQILEAFVSPLIQRNVLMKRDIPSLTKYQLIMARDQFRKNPSPNVVGMQQGIIEGEFAVCISLYHGYELLQQMGMRSLYFFLCGIMDGTKGLTRAKNELSRNEDFMELYSHLQCVFARTRDSSASDISAVQKGDKDKNFFYSHPKLKKLEEVVVEHFKSWNAQNTSGKKHGETRVMIFSSFRDSVQEIAEMLLQHHPVIRVMTFVGHASGKGVRGFTQREQLEVVRQFRDGGYNTLVSTCVGEEGLDIGEVDLIVCFDAQKSPVRLIQRMGRTGRRRQGRIVVILAEGREERTYNQSQSNKRSIYKAISGNRQVLHFYHGSPRMVPEGINPELHKMFISHSTYEPKKPAHREQRRPSLLAWGNGIRQNSSKKNWFLSKEEFKLWNRLYRLRESDEVKEIVLPPAHFPSLPDEDPRPTLEAAAGTHQLSLSEWRVWQDRLLPTHCVDHSDRCHQFVSIMGMIEGMRHEEGECSYELELKSYLHMEDVSSTFSTSRNENSNPASDVFTTYKKSSFTKSVNQANLFSVTESDEECDDIFKPVHSKPTKTVSLKQKAFKEMKEDQPNKENSVNSDFLHTDKTSTVETSFQVDLSHDQRSSDADGFAAPCTISEKVINQSDALLTAGQFTNKPNSFAGNALDSGYNSFSDEKSVSSNLLLPFEEELFTAGTDEEVYNRHSLSEEVLADVERFLARSPPPLSGLSALEQEIMKLENLEHLQNFNSTSLMSHSADNTQQNLELDSDGLINHPSEKSCPFSANNDKISDEADLCAWDDEGHKNIKNENFLSKNHVRIHTDPAKTLVDVSNHDLSTSDSLIMAADQNESLLLFDDVNDELNDVNLSLLNNCKSVCVSDKPIVNEMAPVSQFLISDELLLDDDSEPQDQVLCDMSNWTSPQDLKDKPGEKLQSEGCVFDCSRDLFSVTFDLGFCSPDSDDELLEFTADKNQDRLQDDVSGRYVDIEINDTHYVSNQPSDLAKESTSGTVPVSPTDNVQSPQSVHLTLTAANKKESLSPGLSHFLPLGEKAMSTPLSKANTSNSFSNIRKERLKTPESKKKVNQQGFKQTLNSTFDYLGFSPEKAQSHDRTCLYQSCHFAEVLINNESEDDEIFIRKSKKPKGNVLKSPEDQKSCEADSPVHAVKKRRVLRSELSSSDESENCNKSHQQSEEFKSCHRNARKGIKAQRKQSHLKHVAKVFLDDEAELSEEDEKCVSSDENDSSEDEQDTSLVDFLNDATQLSQAINDTEMRGVYMKSLHSPWMSSKCKTVHKKHNNINVFSQISDQDEAYLEDSFCVHDEDSCRSQSSEDEICVDFNLITEDCFASGSKKYTTRRAAKLKQMKMKQNCTHSKKKLSRIILQDDSSEEEDSARDTRESDTVVKPISVGRHSQQDLPLTPSKSSVQLKVLSNPRINQAPEQRQQTPLNVEEPISGVLDHNMSKSPSLRIVEPQRDCMKYPAQVKVSSAVASPGISEAHCPNSRSHLAEIPTSLRFPPEGKRTCILVDSREITSGVEVISSLRATHGLHVEVCPLNGCDYIVSNRMAVERRSQSEMLNTVAKNKLIQQIKHLHSMFERVCVIVEKDREKTGNTSRIFRRTKSYDSLLTTLIGAGIRILFSSCQEESADLLKELSLVEERKNVGIHVPTVVNSSKREALQFYLSIPSVSYITALNMCHQFSSVKKMANSSPKEISMYAQVTHQKAEEIYRYIHYVFDMQMLPNDLDQDRLKFDT
ncbi:Fanconi anemia group M protein [Ctenodactylus gundi]